MTSLPPASRPAQIAAVGLREPESASPELVPSRDWPSLRGAVVGHRLTGLALEASERGELRLPDAALDELEELQRDAMTHALLLERRLVEVNSALTAGGIEFVVLKGPAIAHTCYPDPAWRPFSDLDLLVRRGQWAKACELLTTLGYRRELPEPRPGFDVRFGKAVTFNSEEGTIDLHSTLASGSFGVWIDPDVLFESTESFALGGAKLKRLDDTVLLLHACVHASLGWAPPLLLPLRDVLQISSTLRIDWERFGELATRWHLDPVLQHAFGTASRVLSIAPPAQAEHWLELTVGRRERLILDAYTTERRARGGMTLAMLRALPGIRSKAAYMRSLMLPKKEFLQARADQGQRPSYLRRMATPAGWMISARRDR